MSYQIIITDLIGSDRTYVLRPGADRLLFNMLTDETDTERQYLHKHALQLSNGSEN